MIRGEKVYLTELNRGNAEIIRAWLNDPEVHEFLLVGHVPITVEQEQRYYDTQALAGDRFSFEIHLLEDGRYLGNVGLKGIHPVHRRAELGLVVGAKDEWGKGYGSDAIVTCLRFAFFTLGLHSVSIRAHEAHARALDLYRRLGFVEVGREREAVFQDGHFGDYVELDMLEREFREIHGPAE
ncbi:MAG: GNAT family N-acetyltransferase [Actinobacteria bacterium]|nr:GNAT family N-acetyltransferase [Actinomycetota bacterium]